jgi:glycogen operon protein
MISHGDELGRTQHGNNNVYGQDSQLSWIDWNDARNHELLTRFTATLTRLRATHPIFRRRRFFNGEPVAGSKAPDIAWLRRDGQPMTDQDWRTHGARTVAVFLNGQGIPELDALGEHIVDDSFLLLFNASTGTTEFILPDQASGQMWETAGDCGSNGVSGLTRRA